MGNRCGWNNSSPVYYNNCPPPVYYNNCPPPVYYNNCPPPGYSNPCPPVVYSAPIAGFSNVKYTYPTEQNSKYSGIIKFSAPVGITVLHQFNSKDGRGTEGFEIETVVDGGIAHFTIKVPNDRTGVFSSSLVGGETRSFEVKPYHPKIEVKQPKPEVQAPVVKPPPPERINFPKEIFIGSGTLPIPKDATISVKRDGTIYTGGPEYEFATEKNGIVDYGAFKIIKQKDGTYKYEAAKGAEGKYKIKINGSEYLFDVNPNPEEEAKKKEEIDRAKALAEAKKAVTDLIESGKEIADGAKTLSRNLGETFKSVASSVHSNLKDITDKAIKSIKEKEVIEPKLKSNEALVIIGENGKLDLPTGVKLKKITKEARPGVLPNGSLSLDLTKDNKDSKLEGGLKFDKDGNYNFDSNDNEKLAPGKYEIETLGGQKIKLTVEPKLTPPKSPIILGENGNFNLPPGLEIKEIKRQPGIGTLPVPGLHGTFDPDEKIANVFQINKKGKYTFDKSFEQGKENRELLRAAGEYEIVSKGGQKIKILIEPKVEQPKDPIILGENGKINLPIRVRLESVRKAPRQGIIPNGSLSVDFNKTSSKGELEGGFQINEKGEYKFSDSYMKCAVGEFEAKTKGGQIIKFKVHNNEPELLLKAKEEAKKIATEQTKLKKIETESTNKVKEEKKKADILIQTTDKSNIPEIEKAKQKFTTEMEEANELRKKGELVKAVKKETEAIIDLKKVTVTAELTDNAYKEKIEEGRKLVQEKKSKNESLATIQTDAANGIDTTIKTTKNNKLGWYEYIMLGPLVSRGIDYTLVDKTVDKLRTEQKMRRGLADQYTGAAGELGEFLSEANKLREKKDYKAELGKIEDGVKHAGITDKKLKIDKDEVDKKVNEMVAQIRKDAEIVMEAAEQTEKGLRIAKDQFAEYAAKVVSKRTGVPEEFCKLAILSLSNLGELTGDIASGNKTSEDALNASLDRLIDDSVDTLADKLISKGLNKIKLPKSWEKNTVAKGAEEKVKDQAKDIIKSVLSKGIKKTIEELRKNNPDDFSDMLENILKEAIMETIQEKIPFYKQIIELKDK